MGKEFASRIREAAPLHDIGKVGIPDAILLKPGKLDEAEFEQMRGHSRYGRDMCRGPCAGPRCGRRVAHHGRASNHRRDAFADPADGGRHRAHAP